MPIPSRAPSCSFRKPNNRASAHNITFIMSSLSEFTALMPPCALTCLLTAIGNSTCVPTDQACTCGNEALNNQATACIMAACTIPESLTALNATKHLCGVGPSTNHSFVPILTVFIIIAGVVVVMRLLARILMNMALWWDDWANFAAMLICIAYTAYILKLKDGGLGTDLWAVPLENINSQLIGYYATAIFYAAARFLIRISIILFYTRVFRTPWAKRLIWGSFIFSVLISIPPILVIAFECTPVSYYWSRWDGEHAGHCINTKAFIWAVFVLLLLNDLWLMGIPLYFVAKLQLSLKKKLLASAMFCVGIVVFVISLYKLSLIDLYTHGTNPSLDVIPMTIWAGIEIDIGVACACMPSMPILFRPVISRFKGSTFRTSTANRNAGSASQCGLGSNQNKKWRFMRASSQPPSVHGSNNDQIRMVTTIHQSHEPPEPEPSLPLYEPTAIELSTLNPSHVRVHAWS
ncbi:hypothetical protein F4819DRAFT_36661 [Hypoxylon fuscum]|nr:hypothetical protein F4819DRAFT_36661 [Hypoxylon fuscum]